MGRLAFGWKTGVAGLVLVVVAAAGGAWLAARGRSGGAAADPPADARPRSFRDGAAEAGLHFRMRFLPGEQGEAFKINLYDHGAGVAVGDFDGDGHDDIYFCNQLGPNALYRNKGDGTFEDVTARAGVGLGDRICVAATFADYDNDGRQDLFVTSTRGGNVLFHNRGDGTFEDVTKAAGVAYVGHSQTAVFFDYDGDGFLDLLVANTARWTTDQYDPGAGYFVGPKDFWALAGSPKEDNILYRNNGDGTFTDVTAQAGLRGKGWSGDVCVFDYDEDGRPDVLVTQMFGASQLYRNNGDGTFTEVTAQVLGRTSWGAIGARAFDFNNDGRLDLLITDMHSDMWMPPDNEKSYDVVKKGEKRRYPSPMGAAAELVGKAAAARLEEKITAAFQIRHDQVVFGNALYQNRGQGKFEDVTDRAGAETFWPWGIATGDFDNDGYEDVFIPSGMGHPFYYWPNYLLMNNGDETFTDRAEQAGIEPPAGGTSLPERIGDRRAPRSSRCAATADFDGDGRLEIVVNNFNDRPYYFRNHFPEKNYVALRLRGTKSNRDAIGAVVRVSAAGGVMTRQVTPAGGYLSQSSKTVHFGLGDAPKVDRIEIRWSSGTTQTLPHPAANRLHDVTEPAPRGAGP